MMITSWGNPQGLIGSKACVTATYSDNGLTTKNYFGKKMGISGNGKGISFGNKDQAYLFILNLVSQNFVFTETDSVLTTAMHLN